MYNHDNNIENIIAMQLSIQLQYLTRPSDMYNAVRDQRMCLVNICQPFKTHAKSAWILAVAFHCLIVISADMIMIRGKSNIAKHNSIHLLLMYSRHTQTRRPQYTKQTYVLDAILWFWKYFSNILLRRT